MFFDNMTVPSSFPLTPEEYRLFDRALYRKTQGVEEKKLISREQEIVIARLFDHVMKIVEEKEKSKWPETAEKIKIFIQLLNQSRFKNYNLYANKLFFYLKKHAQDVLKIDMPEFTLDSSPTMLSPYGLEKCLEHKKLIHSPIKIHPSENDFIHFFKIFLEDCEAEESFQVVYLTKDCHYMPIYMKKEEGICKILITDSIGAGANYIQDIFYNNSFPTEFKIEIYSYNVERQADFGNCGIFALDDMRNLAKMRDFAIFVFVNKFFNSRAIPMRWNDTFIQIKNFNTLPLPLAAMTQSMRIFDLNTKKCQEKGELLHEDLYRVKEKMDKHLCYDNEDHKINQTAVDKATKWNLFVLDQWIQSTLPRDEILLPAKV